MPCIRCTINQPASDKQKQLLREGFMEAIQYIPGKKPETLMVIIQDNSDIFFHRTSDNSCAFVEVNILLRDDPTESFSKMSGYICDMLESILSIDGTNVYIRFTATKDWAWNGIKF